jgi:hypothetical protein
MTNNSTMPFKDFLWQNKANRLLLITSFIAIGIQLVVFKYFYPFAGFIDADSYVYLETASKNLGFNSYMVGYGTFLRLFSVFTKSDLALVAFQYLFIEGSALLLLFTVYYFFNPNKWIKYFLLLFIAINPLFLYMANYVSSDAYFLALSLVWFTSLIWIINKPSVKLILYHSIILFICFTVRYNALFYPFIFTIAVYFSPAKLKDKILGLGLALVFIGSFVLYTGNKFKELTGRWQYSPFSGWQLANNAMYFYRYVDSIDRKPVPKQFEVLDNMVRKYFDTAHNPFKNPEILQKASTAYMWSPRLTLYKYKNILFSRDSTSPELKKWSSMGPIFSEYGLYIISKYPLYFLEYFVWPNACKYYAPPVEFLDSYNFGESTVKQPAIEWFDYKSSKVFVRTKNLKVTILNHYPLLTGTINVIFILSLLCLLNLGFFRAKTNIRNSIILTSIIWLGNAFFTIFASSVALRFQAFPIILITIFSFIAIDLMFKTAIRQEADRNNLARSRMANNLEDGVRILPVEN